MEGQLDAQVSQPELKFAGCMAASCAAPATAQLEARRLCLEHFVGDSMHEIESRRRQLQKGLWSGPAVESFKTFLATCTTQARELLDSQQDTASPDKDRLLDLLLLSSHVNQRLRRSPRSPASVLVWLRREDPGQTWEEETCTSSISLYGAGLMCRHRVEPGQTVYLCRKDKGARAQARVVYSHFDAAGDRQIGVEILDRDDFWNASELIRACQDSAGPEAAPRSSSEAPSSVTVHADVEIESEPQVVRRTQIPLQLTTQGDEIRLCGVISGLAPARVSTASADKEIPLRIAIAWKNPQ
jgi:hypothetical protein